MGLFTELDVDCMLENTQRLLQLHEHLQVLYLVDHYEAHLLLGDGDVPGVRATGKSIMEALLNLDEILHQYKDVAAYRKKFKT